ncbi:MAG: S1C family serine protease [Sandaracinaceae bacterium]|nr:S1C family serine protease [Sandaracinaceae bacterium]
MRELVRDEEAFDAYSCAVVGVVDRVGPAVASLSVRRWRREGAGSGFLIPPDGILLTNSHVVRGAGNVEVRLQGGRELRATIVGDDPATDLAVVRIATSDLPHVSIEPRTRAVPGRGRRAAPHGCRRSTVPRRRGVRGRPGGARGAVGRAAAARGSGRAARVALGRGRRARPSRAR